VPVTASPYVVEPRVVLQAAEAPPRPERLPHAGRPIRLLVPRLHVDAPVVPIGAPGRILVPPGNPQTLGWWDGGAVPGAAHGGALITGHTVHTGGGAFDDLETLRRGDTVWVRTAKGPIRYEVTGVTVYRKASLARDAAKVFRQRGPGRLVLITCEEWNGTTYLSNAVVFADPVRPE
jgi:LPXTG-site transpeptidase (sortase) family protein